MTSDQLMLGQDTFQSQTISRATLPCIHRLAIPICTASTQQLRQQKAKSSNFSSQGHKSFAGRAYCVWIASAIRGISLNSDALVVWKGTDPERTQQAIHARVEDRLLWASYCFSYRLCSTCQFQKIKKILQCNLLQNEGDQLAGSPSGPLAWTARQGLKCRPNL